MILDTLLEYEKEKKINLKKHPKKDLYLACYTKGTFFDKDWDNITINSRGHVYDKEGNLVCNPFRKIFNLGETPDTELGNILLLNEAYEVYDKVNGHLCILFYYDGEWINITKGSWTHEFIPKDRKILEDRGVIETLKAMSPMANSMTFMFEIVADYDPHTLYEREKYIYEDNQAVLLGVNCLEKTRQPSTNLDLENWSEILGVPSVMCFGFDIGDIQNWYKHRDTEGFVVHFLDSDLRVKVKTTEYLAKRFAKEFKNPKRMAEIFLNYGESKEAFEILPEEFHKIYRSLLEEWKEYRKSKSLSIQETLSEYFQIGVDEIEIRKLISSIDNRSKRSSCFAVLNNKWDILDKILINEFVDKIKDKEFDLSADKLF